MKIRTKSQKTEFITNQYHTVLGGLSQQKHLTFFLMGDIKAMPKPWKPKTGEPYWYYSAGWKEANFMHCEDDLCDMLYWKVGNCFKTKEEANTKGKEIIEQLQKEFEES